MHAFWLRKAERPAYQPLDPRAQVDVLALDLLRVCRPHRMRLCRHMPFVGSPAVSAIARDATGLSQGLPLEKPLVLPMSKDIRHHLPTLVIKRMPEPPRLRFLPDRTPQLIEF